MLCWGLPFSLGYQVLRNFATALSRPHAPLIVMVISIGFNALGDYGLIFGHFGLPRLGLVGSGIASACSYAFGFLAMLVVVRLTPALRNIASSGASSARIWRSSAKCSGSACRSASP